MAVMIKDMNIPKSCRDCNLYRFLYKEFWPRPIEVCCFTRKEISETERLEDCPLLEVK